MGQLLKALNTITKYLRNTIPKYRQDHTYLLFMFTTYGVRRIAIPFFSESVRSKKNKQSEVLYGVLYMPRSHTARTGLGSLGRYLGRYSLLWTVDVTLSLKAATAW